MIDVFPLRNDADYKRALSLIENTPPGDEKTEEAIEILSQLVKLWEKEHHAFDPVIAPYEILRELMLLKQTPQTEIATLLGTAQSNVSAILSGKRKLNSAQAEILAAHFGVDPSKFGRLKAPRFSVHKPRHHQQRA
jgi:HTH-type transcriptional regulator/antitoxin HigA